MISFSQEEVSAIYLSLKIAFTASITSMPLAIVIGYFLQEKTFFLKS